MIWIPKCAEHLAALCAREQGRFSLQSVRLTLDKGGLFRLEATDGKRLGVLRGPSVACPQDQAAAERLPDPGPLRTELLIGAGAFKAAAHQVPARKKGGPERRLGVLMADPCLAVAGDGTLLTLPGGTGRFPDVNAVLPSRPALVSLRVDPLLLAELLRVAAAVSQTNNECQVTLALYGKDRPLAVVTTGAEGMAFDAILMPLT